MINIYENRFRYFITTYLCYLFNIYGIHYVSPTVAAHIYLQIVLTSIIAVWSGREKMELNRYYVSIFGGLFGKITLIKQLITGINKIL